MTWNLMIGKNQLWVAEQHGHGVQVMLNMYAAWLRGPTEADIERIRQAMQSRPRALMSEEPLASTLVVTDETLPVAPATLADHSPPAVPKIRQ